MPRFSLMCLLGLFVVAACERQPDPAPTAGVPEHRAEEADSTQKASPEQDRKERARSAQVADDQPAGPPQPIVTDLDAMRRLEELGFSLGERLGVADADTLQELSRHRTFGSISRVIERDLEEFRQEDPHLGVAVRGNPHRLFNPAWLRSSAARFELIGVISRLDRRHFVDAACGEVRLVYRMNYQTEVDGQPVASRLPFTLALDWLELAPEGDSCEHVARRWQIPEDLAGAELADWLVSEDGPLDKKRMAHEAIDRLLLNMQSLRWPSTTHPGLGGHAEYVLRSFEPDGQGMFVPEPLENTPDVDRLEEDEDLRGELVAWLKEPERLREIDQASVNLPDKFLAKRAISAAPRGLARRSNRPFFQLLSTDVFEDVDFEQMRHMRSAAGLIRRLDDHSCAGCHQGRAVAGFHLLGEEPEETVAANALAVPMSAHAAQEQRRRTRLLRTEAGGGAGDYNRGFSERDGDRPGAWGAPCGLTDDATFSDWDCADGLICTPYDTPRDAPHVGVCVPDEPQVGDPCEVARITSRSDPADDRAVAVESRPCPEGAGCNKNRVGFPGGMCTTLCDDPGENGRCGAIAVLETFNECLARSTPFDKCLSRHVSPAGLRACDAEHPCRHDYLCAKNADGDGVCIPPYFLFQMRVDGHPEAQ